MKKVIFFVAGCAALSWAALSFTEQPSVRFNAGTSKWDIRFALSDSTDVEVTLLKASDSSVVRRLTAGRLGGNPPLPLKAGTLVQTLEWDGCDDLGVRADSTQPFLVRVRAGMAVSLDKTVGVSNYYFAWISGSAFSADGKLCVWGASSGISRRERTGPMALRQFDETGAYCKTLFPFPAGMDTSLVTPWNAYKRPNTSKYMPTYFAYWMPWLVFSGSMVNVNNKVTDNHLMIPLLVDNRVMVYNADSFCLTGLNSSMEKGRATRLLPLQTSQGPFFAWSPDKAQMFYAMGRTLFRFNPLTGVATALHAFTAEDSVQSPVSGIVFDDSGHVLISDPTSQRVWVYDTTAWTLAGSIRVTFAHQIALNPGTGEVYVLSRNMAGAGPTDPCVIRCFSDWRNPVLKDSLTTGITVAATGEPVQFRLTAQSPDAVLCAAGGNNIQFFRDDGKGFTIVRDFAKLAAGEHNGTLPNVYERLAVDRKKEAVYVTTGYSAFYRISDWTAPRAVPCTSSTRQRLWAAEPCISPDGFLYVQQGDNVSSYAGPVTKWTTDDYPAPANYGTSGSNVADTFLYERFGAANGIKGIAVSRDNRVADIPIVDNTWARYILRIIEPSDPAGSRARQLTSGYVEPLADHGAWMDANMDCPFNVGSVKFDYDGNIYVSSSLTAPGHALPSRYPMVPTSNYKNITVGAVYKFPPSGGGLHRTSATGALKAYTQGLSIFSGGANEWGVGCVCRSPRFDLDPWGRLYIPNGLLCEVAVADNNGNTLVKFGEYGNVDSWGPESPVPGPAIPFASPQCVAASDDYLYISDMNNLRLVRVRMSFELDNLPLLSPPVISAEDLDVQTAGPDVHAYPNPFNPSTRLSLKGFRGGATFTVRDVSGRMVLVKKGVIDGYCWNAERLPSGIYLLTVEKGALRRTVRATLLK